MFCNYKRERQRRRRRRRREINGLLPVQRAFRTFTNDESRERGEVEASSGGRVGMLILVKVVSPRMNKAAGITGRKSSTRNNTAESSDIYDSHVLLVWESVMDFFRSFLIAYWMLLIHPEAVAQNSICTEGKCLLNVTRVWRNQYYILLKAKQDGIITKTT